eukprot:TRINITY_DN5474_c0_g1_i2.p1 TRINITY_DN5474_c0_g1~~TRINITY_DN5474_c0_g1_i2.p1  ORF type:complete len:569 (+),score=226.77 TRINITY_DN5474_c0_g1_i2:50-1708(+)
MGAGSSASSDKKGKEEQEQRLAKELQRIVGETHYELLTPPHIIKRLEEVFQAKLTKEQHEVVRQHVENVLRTHFRSHYKVGPILGKGGYSTVHACVKQETKEECAVKVIDKQKLSRNALKSLTEEIRIMQQLTHPRLIRLHDVYDHGSTMYLVMEKVEGGELFDEIVRLQRYAEDVAAEIMFNFLDGLGYMHQRGYVHRDIKPENILLLRKPQYPTDICKELKIADFGFSANVGDGETLTTCCGTPRYIAPEVLNVGLFQKGSGYGKTCDMWAVGVIAYILLFGKAPFYHKDRNQLWHHICNGIWSMPPEAQYVSEDARNFILSLIVVDSKARFTVEQAQQHPFIANRSARPTTHLEKTQEALLLFNAKQKLKGAIFGVQSLSRVAYVQKCLALGVKTNTAVVQKIDTGMISDETEHLDMRNNYVGAKGLIAILEMIQEGCPNVLTLNLAGNSVNNTVIDLLVEVAAAHPKLEAIDLSDNPLSYKAGQALLSLAKKNSRIKSIELVNTKIQEGILRQINTQLEVNRSGKMRDYFNKGKDRAEAAAPDVAPAP